MVKRQFVQFKPVLGDKDTEQTAVPTGIEAVDTNRARIAPPPQETLSSPAPQLRAKKTGGLLSGWKAEHTQEPRNATSDATLPASNC